MLAGATAAAGGGIFGGVRKGQILGISLALVASLAGPDMRPAYPGDNSSNKASGLFGGGTTFLKHSCKKALF